MENINKEQQAQIDAAAAENEKKIKKNVITVAVVVIAAVVICLGWYFFSKNHAAKANEAIGLADIEQNDSIALSYYEKAATMGSKSGERAKLHAAIAYYQKGEYQQALDYLKDASVSSPIAEAGRFCLMGDCYVNLEDYTNALSAYNKAIGASDDNPQIVPFVLVKEANIYRAQGNYDAEYKAYQTILDKYPDYAATVRADIRKYAERAKFAAGK